MRGSRIKRVPSLVKDTLLNDILTPKISFKSQSIKEYFIEHEMLQVTNVF